MTRKKLSPRADCGDRDFAAIGAFRYALGRMTYITGMTAEWLQQQWPVLDEHARKIIERDLDAEIVRDNEARASGLSHKPLGWDCDREAWVRLRDFIKAYSEAA